MKKNKLNTILFALLILTLTFVAVSAAAGSVDDPVISLSYLTNVFKPALKSEITGELALEAKRAVEEAKPGIINEVKNQVGSGSSEFTTVQIKKGQMVSPTGSGSIEVILRRGNYVCVDQVGENIPNLTTGQDVAAGKEMPLQNLYIIPKNDGRGIKAVGESDGWIMVRGSYQIVNS